MKDEALAAIAAKTKPPGSLGRLEDLAVDLAVFQGTLRPEVDPARLVVFGADHGVTAEGDDEPRGPVAAPAGAPA